MTRPRWTGTDIEDPDFGPHLALPWEEDSGTVARMRKAMSPPRSRMPKGATLSPAGDLGARRAKEAATVFPARRAPRKKLTEGAQVRTARSRES